MNKHQRIVVLAGLTSVFAVAQANKPVPPIEVITPIFHQLFAFNLPEGFNFTAPEQKNKDFYLHEIVLRGETLDHWTKMVTVTGMRGGVAKGVTAQRTVQTIASHIKQDCPTTFAVIDVGAMQVSGQRAYLAVAGCGSVADQGGRPGAVHSETALIISIEGDQDIYTLQSAERAAAINAPPQIDGVRWKGVFMALNPHVCAQIEGEQPPYPGCAAK